MVDAVSKNIYLLTPSSSLPIFHVCTIGNLITKS